MADSDKKERDALSRNDGIISRTAVMWLLVLMCQTTTHFLVVRFTRATLHLEYDTSVLLFFVELTKLVCSTIMIAMSPVQDGRHSSDIDGQETTMSSGALLSRLAYLTKTALPVAVPALIYFVQNWLLYYGLANLQAAVFSILNQLKIMTTGIFSVILLHKHLTWGQWRALFLLVCGSALIQSQALRYGEVDHSDDSAGTVHVHPGDPVMGGLAALATATLSGLAGVYFEKVLKHKMQEFSIWDRNFQLSLFSVVLAFVSTYLSTVVDPKEVGLMHDFNAWTWFVVLESALGGFLVAIAVKHSSMVVKGFATTGALVCTSVFGMVFLGENVDFVSSIGGFVAITGIFNYKDVPKQHQSPPPPSHTQGTPSSVSDSSSEIHNGRDLETAGDKHAE